MLSLPRYEPNRISLNRKEALPVQPVPKRARRHVITVCNYSAIFHGARGKDHGAH
jgi:hypothetical protein